MNPLRWVWLPRWCWGLLVLFVLVGLLPGKAAGPQPADRPAVKVEQRVFPLRHIAVGDALQVLRDLLGDAIGPKGSIRISGDAKANSLIVRAERAKLDEVAAIVRAIDTERPSAEKPGLQFWTLSLKSVEPDQTLDEALRLAFGSRGKFVVDRQRRLLFASADEPTIERVRKLLTILDIASSQKSPTDLLAGLRVTVFWLVSGPVRGKASGLPAELTGLAGELRDLGRKPHLAARVVTTTAPDFRFENTSTVQLAGPGSLSVAGTAALKKHKVELNLTIGLKQGSRQSASLHTQVSAVPNRPVLLGVTATDALTSAFVVSVGGTLAEGPGEKKVGMVKPSDKWDDVAWVRGLKDLMSRIPAGAMRITSMTAEPVPQSGKTKFVGRLTLKGELPNRRDSRRALDQLIALVAKESRYSPQAPKVAGKRLTLVVNVQEQPAADKPGRGASEEGCFRSGAWKNASAKRR